MRIQHYEYDVDGETRRLLVLSETTVDLQNGFEEEWRERTGFHGVVCTRERVQLGEYFEPDVDAVDKLVESVSVPDGLNIAATELKYGTLRPIITREQAGKAYHDAQGDPCYGWEQHGVGTIKHFTDRGVAMLQQLGIEVED